jgi:segregation and condensation protein A
LSPEAEDVGDELVRQLQAYKRFKEIASVLHKREKQGLHSYVRIAPLPRPEPQLDLGKVTLDDLLTVVQQALDAVPAPPAGEVVSPVTVTIAEQITCIVNQLTHQRQVRFHDILSEATTRVEVIVTLLALLELIKQDRVQVRQEQMFGEIIIERQTPVETQAQTTTAGEPATNPAA